MRRRLSLLREWADKALPVVVLVMFVTIIGLATLTQRNNRNNEDIRDTVQRVEESITHVEDQVDRLDVFVDDLEAPNPEDEARNAAITEAVNQVPEIRGILCEQFPEATACQGG